jgi:hypothetical protein
MPFVHRSKQNFLKKSANAERRAESLVEVLPLLLSKEATKTLVSNLRPRKTGYGRI